MVSYPDHPKTHLHPLEAFLLESAPTTLATQERFCIFKAQIQNLLFEGISIASIPCGFMRCLFELDYSFLSSFSFYGFDTDENAVKGATALAKEKELTFHLTLKQQDAWKIDRTAAFDLIISNGLNIYEKEDARITELYQNFYHALKKQGTFITSFLTPPPIPGREAEWKMDEIHQPDALLQKILFADVINGKWQVFRAAAEVKNQLKQAGFKTVSVIYDRAHIFPTVLAKRD